MITVLALAVALWFLGRALQASIMARGMMLAVLFAAVLLFQITLPEAHPLREATGGSLANWAIVAAILAVIAGYALVLRRLRQKHAEQETPGATSGSFKPEELDRYARHIVLREIGGPGQKALKHARVLVIGAGGLGAPVLQYLAAAGVGTIGVIDDDVVENSNLQRQVIHTDARIGMPKVFSAQEAVAAQNPFVTLKPYHRRLSEEIAAELFAEYDLILDGCDNFETRYLVNRTCVALEKPLISGAITQWEGQISLFHPASDAPCYHCIFPDPPADGLAPTCAEAGVMGALPGVLGAMMAGEAIKWIAGAGTTLAGRLMIFDLLYADSRVITIMRRPDCPVCGKSGNDRGAQKAVGKL